MKRALQLSWVIAMLALSTRHTLGALQLVRPEAFALIALAALFPRWRALTLVALGLALVQPSYRPEGALAIVTDGAPPTRDAIQFADGDIENALSRAAATVPDRGRIALFSSSQERAGDVLRAAHDLAARQIQLFVSVRDDQPHEVGFAALDLPSSLQVGTPFELSATLTASHPIAVTLQWMEDGAVLASHDLQLASGEHVQRFPLRARAGETTYRVALIAHGPDQHSENNAIEQHVRVADRPRVLLLDSEPAQADAFRSLLRGAGFGVELRAPNLDDYDFVILSDLPASALPPQRALLDYVHNGGGLLVAGGEHAFGAGGYRGSTLERLLPVTLAGADARNEASLALVLAIDKSGSMAGDKLERAKEAALATAALLPDDAYLGVIGFDVEATRIVRITRARAGLGAISQLAAGGGTALFPALDAAYADLAGVRAQVKHVVVLTDGQTQEEALADLVRAMHADGITLSTVGLGADVQRGLLEALAKLARGRAYFTRDPSQIPRLFVEEAERVAHSLVVERATTVKQVAPAGFMRGIAIADAPPLRGFVSTLAKPNTSVLETGDGAPLLARMRFGEGWSLAWTSDLKPRWSAPWFAWPAQAQLFAQLIREHMRAADTLALETRFVGDELQVRTDAIDEHGRFVNGLTGTVRAAEREFAFEPIAPGRYLARVPAPSLGSYTLRAQLGDRRGRSTAVRPASIAPASARARLDEAARITGGGAMPNPAQLLSDRRDATPRPLAGPLLWLALVAFLIDIAARRVGRSRP